MGQVGMGHGDVIIDDGVNSARHAIGYDGGVMIEDWSKYWHRRLDIWEGTSNVVPSAGLKIFA